MEKTCTNCVHCDVCFLRIAMWEGVVKQGQAMLSQSNGLSGSTIGQQAMLFLGSQCQRFTQIKRD